MDERGNDYGEVYNNWKDIADLWTVILGHPITASRAALCMVAVKLAREAHSHKWDNLVDIAGYAECLGRIYEQESKEQAD